MLIEYWVCKVQTQQLPQVQSGRGCAEAGHRDWQRGFISSCRRCKLLPNPTAKSCSSLHGENWQMRFPLTSEPTESGSNIASVCYPRSFISFQLIKLFCGSPAHMPLSWSRTRCSFSSFAIRPLGTPMKTGKSRQRAWNSRTVLSEDKEGFGGEAAVDEHHWWEEVAAVEVAVDCKVGWLLKETEGHSFVPSFYA